MGMEFLGGFASGTLLLAATGYMGWHLYHYMVGEAPPKLDAKGEDEGEDEGDAWECVFVSKTHWHDYRLVNNETVPIAGSDFTIIVTCEQRGSEKRVVLSPPDKLKPSSYAKNPSITAAFAWRDTPSMTKEQLLKLAGQK